MAPRLYHISENPNLTVMTPRIPSNKLVKAGYENGTIGRVCFAPTIDYAIAAAPRGKAGELLYVYIPTSVDKSAIYHPTPQEVPDVTYTHEVWYLKPVTVKKVCVILVGDAYLEQRFLGPDSYKQHFILRFQKYKRFKNLPTEQEQLEYFKTQPEYYSYLKQKANDKKRNALISKVLTAAAGVPLLLLVGNKLKNIVKENLTKDSFGKSRRVLRVSDAVKLDIITLKKTRSEQYPDGYEIYFDVMHDKEKIGEVKEIKRQNEKTLGKRNVSLGFWFKPGQDKRALVAHIMKRYFEYA